MEYQAQTKNCQNCKKDFTIESEDFKFYEKIKVPPPTFCPECRLQRRLAWMIGLNLFKRKCDLCEKEVFSMYEPDIPFVIYCHQCWWSDKWDSRDCSLEVDFSKPFLEQWKELLQKTPILGLSIDTISGELSPYTNHTGNSKNCYMIYYSDFNEESIFGYELVRNKYILNSSLSTDCELSFDNINSFKNYKVFGSKTTKNSIECAFLRDCINCQNCFCSVNLRNKSYVFLNKQHTKKEYEQMMKEIDLGSYKVYQEYKNKAEKLFLESMPKPEWSDFSENYTGSFIYQSKNCKECYEVVHSYDSKYLMLIKERTVKNCYDYTDWGLNAELIYDSITVGNGASNIKFCHESAHGISDVEYSKLSTGSSYNFGCVSIKKTKYCILNKEYSKEEYFQMVEKIKKHMNEMPYIDKKGNIYKYGEFFPAEFSPHAYNNSFANFFFPKNEEEILKDNLRFYKPNIKEYPITLQAINLSDNIKDVSEKILKEVIQCSTCQRGYKIIKQELDLSKRLNVPLSRQCPFCRIEEKVKKWVKQMKQIDRICDKCGVTFKTHYSKEEAPKIYCKKCYQQEVY